MTAAAGAARIILDSSLLLLALVFAQGRLTRRRQAFRCELVPQDPTDEPASVLLESLRGERREQMQTRPKRGRKAATA